MPAIVHYKPPYPTEVMPVNASHSVDSRGVISGQLTFLTPPSSGAYQIEEPVNPSLLPGVAAAVLFVESRSFEKVNGLSYLRVGVSGCLARPIIAANASPETKGFSKTRSFLQGEGEVTRTFSFTYSSERIVQSTVVPKGKQVTFPKITPRLLEIFNREGRGRIADFDQGIVFANDAELQELLAVRRVYTTTSRFGALGLDYVEEIKQLVYE
jgi:hypothetical protein